MNRIEAINLLRKETGANIAECKQALSATGEDLVKAREWLRLRASQKAIERDTRGTEHGRIFTYAHYNGQVGAMVAIYCETDFVARCDQFVEFGQDLAMQITAMAPADVIDLLKQPPLREEQVATVQEMLEQLSLAVGEKIVIGSFQRYAI